MSDPSDVVVETRALLARITAASVEHDAALLARAAFGGCVRLDDDAGTAAVHREQDALGALFTLGNDLRTRAHGLLSRLCDEVVALREHRVAVERYMKIDARMTAMPWDEQIEEYEAAKRQLAAARTVLAGMPAAPEVPPVATERLPPALGALRGAKESGVSPADTLRSASPAARAVLVAAKSLLQRGWCQGWYARSSWRACWADDSNAIAWSAYGACCRAAVDVAVNREAGRILVAYMQTSGDPAYEHALEYGSDESILDAFNDTQESVEPVLALFDKTLAALPHGTP